MQQRPQAGAGWSVWRATVGLSYLAAAGFNLFFTLPRGDLEFFADMAWSGWIEEMVRDVLIPNHEAVVLGVVVFEAVVGLLVLHRGRAVGLGVMLAVGWVLALLPFLQPFPHATVNVGLAVGQGLVLLRRYDKSLWEQLVVISHRTPHFSR